MNKIRQLAWMLAACLAVTTTVKAQQSVDKCEWWLDADFANRTQVAITDSWQQNIDASALSVGIHQLGLRVGDSNGLWGQPVIRHFLVQRVITPVDNALSTYEYWIDNQYDARQTGNVGEGGTVALDLDMSALSAGIHQIAIRVNDTQKHVSQMVVRSFLVQRVITPVDNALSSYEYWIDNQYDTRQVGNVGEGGIVALDLNMGSLSAGLHQIAIRVNDTQKHVSQLVVRSFLVVKNIETKENSLATFRYWIDNQINQMVTTSVASGEVAVDIDTKALSAGLHRLHYQLRDAQGLYGAANLVYFSVPDEKVSDNQIVAYEYWFDQQARKRVEVTPTTSFTLTDAEIAIEDIEPKAVTEDYTFDVATRLVTVQQEAEFGLQVFNNMGVPTTAITDNINCTVNIEPAFKTIINEESDLMAEAPTGAKIRGYEFDCGTQDPIYWIVEGAELKYDFYDGEGNCLTPEVESVNARKAYVVVSPTGKVVALAYGADPNAATQTSKVTVQVPAIIDAIKAQEAKTTYDVYTLSGIPVRRKATTLEGLPSGLYIINGKKVFIK